MKAFWRIAPWFSRLVLLLPTVVFFMIAAKYMANPIQEAATRQITLASPDAISTARIGFGAFPLAFAILTLSCLRRRLLDGLQLVTTVLGVATAVRFFGILVDGAGVESLKLLLVAAIFLLLLGAALIIESRRRRYERERVEPASGLPDRMARASP